MSALAEIALSKGFAVTGSDRQNSPYFARLRRLGADMRAGHSADYAENPDAVVYSSAVPESNPELARARSRGIPCLERCRFLGVLSKEYKTVIAVAGTHGKTSTTAMLSHIFAEAKKFPTMHLGGNSVNLGGNVRVGGEDYFITEACEYRRSFLSLEPDIALVLNISFDHPDTYADLNDVKQAFYEFASQVNLGGVLISNADDKNSEFLKNRAVTFGIYSDADYRGVLLEESGSGCAFDVYERGKKLITVRDGIYGLHNIYNALAACAAARCECIEPDVLKNALESYRGVQRRFERVGSYNGMPVISDYAHHPEEIRSAIRTARAMQRSVTAVFQPHTYSRTQKLMDEFAKCFEGADCVGILPVYSARETGSDEVSVQLAQNVCEQKTPCEFVESEQALGGFLDKHPNSLILMIGAGDIDDMARRLAVP